MSEEILIEVNNVSKRFCKDLKRSMRYGFKDSLRAIVGKETNTDYLRKDEFWAVKDVSFKLKRGECLGLIGHNGAGKSTLLKMMNGLINPDKGDVLIRGRVGALIELGAGFNPILTGRENVYNNGSVLGFTRNEIEKKIDEIIDFAEIRDFIDSPVQNYSSGMRVRLGFAVAAQMEPDVLLIDEVLAVGDVGFSIKCLNKISELLKKCAVIYVSHSMPQVGKICNKAIHLRHGMISMFSDNVNDVIQSYYSEFKFVTSNFIFGNGKAKISELKLTASAVDINNTPISYKREDIVVKFNLSIDSSIRKYFISVSFFNMEMRSVAVASTTEEFDFLINDTKEIQVELKVKNFLSIGKYNITIDIIELRGNSNDKYGDLLISLQNVEEFISVGVRQTTYCPIQLPGLWSITKIDF